MQVNYEPEANIISFEVGSGTISFAKEMNGTIIHFTAGNKPILIEILQAGNFLTKISKLKKAGQAVRRTAASPSG